MMRSIESTVVRISDAINQQGRTRQQLNKVHNARKSYVNIYNDELSCVIHIIMSPVTSG